MLDLVPRVVEEPIGALAPGAGGGLNGGADPIQEVLLGSRRRGGGGDVQEQALGGAQGLPGAASGGAEAALDLGRVHDPGRALDRQAARQILGAARIRGPHGMGLCVRVLQVVAHGLDGGFGAHWQFLARR